jgi:hypothetical protein
MNPYQQLIKVLHAYPSKTWINRYFDLQRKLLQTLQIENDDPRLGLSLNKNGSMPANLGQRYVLRPAPDGSISCIVPMDFDDEYVKGTVVFEFSSGKMKDAKFLELDFEKNKPLPALLWQACLLCCEDILCHCRKSGYRKFHQPLLYDFTMEPAVRHEILGEINIME